MRRRINHSIHKLLLLSPPITIYNPILFREELFTINFITLTIPSIHTIVTSTFGYKYLLAPFLRTMRRKYNLQSYIWKAELQERGQLHYHLTTNTWINWNDIRNEWNYLLRMNSLMDEYISENGNNNPNSTDVHKVYKIKDIASYLSKYISKDVSKNNALYNKRNTHTRYSNDVIYGCMISCSTVVMIEDEVLDSKVWDCSLDIKNSALPKIEMTTELDLHLRSLKMQSLISDTATDFCNILKPINNLFDNVMPKDILNAKMNYYDTVRDTTQTAIKGRKKKGKCEMVYED